jgi:3-oxoadipate enol-lactonase
LPKVLANNIEINYELLGRGPRLLYISGTGGDLRHEGSRCRRSYLAEHFSVLAFDQRGLGQTSKPDISYSMKDYADDAASLMEAQGWASANVLGFSFGGIVAQELALRYPDKVEKLVLAGVSSGGKGGEPYPLNEIFHLPNEERIVKAIELIDTRCDEDWRRDNPEQYEAMFAYWENYLRTGSEDEEKAAGARRQMEAGIGFDAYDRLPNLLMPVFICGGKYDGTNPPANLENMHERIPGSKLKFYEAGHMFLGQDPTAMEEIIDFFKA